MLSFKSIAVFATLAFGALSAMAAPAIDHNNVIANTKVARCDCDSVPTILTNLHASVSVHVNELHYITASNCTADAVTPIIANIKVNIGDALVSLKALVGQSSDVILGGSVTVDVVAGLVGDIICSIFGGIQAIISLNVAVALNVLLPLFCSLGEAIGALVSIVLSLCGGILVGLDVAILALIKAYVAVIVKLNVSVLINVLAIV